MLIGLHSPYWGSVFGGGEKYLGVTAEAIRDGFPGHQIELTGPVPADRNRYEERLGLDLHGIELASTTRAVTPLHRWLNGVRPLRPLRDRVLASRAARATARYDLYLAMAYAIPLHSRARRGVILCQFPYRSAEGVAEFEQVICQSEYVRHWVREYWRVDASVVNPPIDVPADDPDLTLKEPLILSVGRFFAGGHSKRHDVLVEAFRSLDLPGWRLALAGSVHRQGPHAGYVDEIRRQASGADVDVYADADAATLRSLYRRATIYWHAAGYGVSDDHPDRREHFGMTIAEAMGYGCVPIVVGAGGTTEVVQHGVDGLLWTETGDLIEQTREVSSDESLRRRLALAARSASTRFSRTAFKSRMAGALQPYFEQT
jgi:glycosyltransferase involved in cell wall biosynthesis